MVCAFGRLAGLEAFGALRAFGPWGPALIYKIREKTSNNQHTEAEGWVYLLNRVTVNHLSHSHLRNNPRSKFERGLSYNTL